MKQRYTVPLYILLERTTVFYRTYVEVEREAAVYRTIVVVRTAVVDRRNDLTNGPY